MFDDLKRDYARAYAQCGYQGVWRKRLHTWTNPGFQAVAVYRLTRWLMHHHIPFVGAVLQRLIEVWSGVSIPPEAKIGPGILILHSGGIVVNGAAVIGEDLTLHHEVTIGNRVSGGGSPVIGHRAMLGVGAKVLGDIQLGDDVDIGANAVVLSSIPDRAVAVGIPARVIRFKSEGKETPSGK